MSIVHDAREGAMTAGLWEPTPPDALAWLRNDDGPIAQRWVTERARLLELVEQGADLELTARGRAIVQRMQQRDPP